MELYSAAVLVQIRDEGYCSQGIIAEVRQLHSVNGWTRDVDHITQAPEIHHD